MQTEKQFTEGPTDPQYLAEFRQLEMDNRLGAARGIFFGLALTFVCGLIIYGAFKIQDTIAPLVGVFFETGDSTDVGH